MQNQAQSVGTNYYKICDKNIVFQNDPRLLNLDLKCV